MKKTEKSEKVMLKDFLSREQLSNTRSVCDFLKLSQWYLKRIDNTLHFLSMD